MQTPERCGFANGVNDTGPNWYVLLRGSVNVFALFLLDLVVQHARALTLQRTEPPSVGSEILCLLTEILLQASVPLKVNSKFNFTSNKSTVHYKSDLQTVATVQIQVAMVTLLEPKNQPYCNYVPWVFISQEESDWTFDCTAESETRTFGVTEDKWNHPAVVIHLNWFSWGNC